MSLKTKYLIFAVLGLGSIGVWLPYILAGLLNENHDIRHLPINLTTYFLAIYIVGCLDMILQQFDRSVHSSLAKSDTFDYLVVLAFGFIFIAG